MAAIHDRLAENGLQFASALHQMSEDLQDLTANMERGRKHWKQTGLNAEKRVQDSEAVMEKAKGKYDSLAEQYDRARTGDKQSGRFGLKGTKSAAQQEEDLHKKVQAADSDYASKVSTAQSQRQELVSQLRPQAVRALRDLINECDSGLTMQFQKFCTFTPCTVLHILTKFSANLNEKLSLGNGLCVSPLKSQANGIISDVKSLRDIAQQVNNEKDFKDYILGFSNKAGSRTTDIKYEKHPVQYSSAQTQDPFLQLTGTKYPKTRPTAKYSTSSLFQSKPSRSVIAWQLQPIIRRSFTFIRSNFWCDFLVPAIES